MTIEDAEHISPEKRQEIIDSYPEYEREARIRGIPVLGSGQIYPVAESSIKVDAFPIPQHWAIIAAMDFGWDHPTAAVQMAHDRDADVLYVGAAYRRSKATPLEHTATLRQWGDWVPWAWPADGEQSDKRSGRNLKTDYATHGLNMLPSHATHDEGGVSVEAGIMEILTRMQTGRFKVFAHLNDWFDECRLYHRKDGKIVKEMDDLMDATRYGVMMLRHATPAYLHAQEWHDESYGRNEVTGY